MSEAETRKDADQQAYAQLASIKEMVTALREARENDGADRHGLSVESAERAIHEDALSVEVRTGWVAVGETDEHGRIASSPEEFRILLCTGGPAVQIWGRLDRWCQPDADSIELQSQGWFIPWQAVKLTSEDRETLAEYARCFYFGEG